MLCQVYIKLILLDITYTAKKLLQVLTDKVLPEPNQILQKAYIKALYLIA